MNRIVVFGLAMFFALVGIALVGGEKKASAFIFGRMAAASSCDGCHGCKGSCHRDRCHGRCHGDRCHGRCHGDRCHGRCHGRCNGGCHGGCCGGGMVQAPEKQAPAPPAPAQAPAK
jgi:hypothetical protein